MTLQWTRLSDVMTEKEWRDLNTYVMYGDLIHNKGRTFIVRFGNNKYESILLEEIVFVKPRFDNEPNTATRSN